MMGCDQSHWPTDAPPWLFQGKHCVFVLQYQCFFIVCQKPPAAPTSLTQGPNCWARKDRLLPGPVAERTFGEHIRHEASFKQNKQIKLLMQDWFHKYLRSIKVIFIRLFNLFISSRYASPDANGCVSFLSKTETSFSLSAWAADFLKEGWAISWSSSLLN